MANRLAHLRTPETLGRRSELAGVNFCAGLDYRKLICLGASSLDKWHKHVRWIATGGADQCSLTFNDRYFQHSRAKENRRLDLAAYARVSLSPDSGLVKPQSTLSFSLTVSRFRIFKLLHRRQTVSRCSVLAVANAIDVLRGKDSLSGRCNYRERFMILKTLMLLLHYRCVCLNPTQSKTNENLLSACLFNSRVYFGRRTFRYWLALVLKNALAVCFGWASVLR